MLTHTLALGVYMAFAAPCPNLHISNCVTSFENKIREALKKFCLFSISSLCQGVVWTPPETEVNEIKN